MKKITLPFVLALFAMIGVNAQIPSYLPNNGLVGWWPFNGNANDESGNGNNGVVNGATLTTDRFGNVGKAYGFDGNDWIEVANSATLQNIDKITISAWVNISSWFVSNGNPYFPILCKSNTTGVQGKYTYIIEPNNVSGHNNTNAAGFPLSNQLELNTWKNIVFIITSTTSSLYIDGNLFNTINVGVNPNPVIQNSPLLFGKEMPGLIEYAIGKIDDIAIYNRALTPQEITALYTGTAPCQSNSSTTNLSIPSTQLPYTWNGLTFNAAGTQTDTLTNAAGCDSLATLNLTVTYDLPSYLPTNGLVGYWPFNGNANDESGNGNHGTVNGATLTTDRFGNSWKAYTFDGVNDFIRCLQAGPSGNPTVSAVFWLKTSQTNYAHIIGYGADRQVGNDFRIVVNVNCQQSIGFDTYGNLNSLTNHNNNDGWNQYVITYDGSIGNNVVSSKIYKNGFLLTSPCSIVNNSSTNIQGIFPVTFGKYHGTVSDGFLNGSLDDIAIYNRALTAQEITALYNGSAPCQSTSSTTNLSIPSSQLPYTWNGLTFTAAGTQTDTLTNAAGCDSLATLNLTTTYDIPSYLPANGLVGYWPFNGNANDESGNGNHGTVNGATSTTDRFGNAGKAYGFDGVDDYIKCLQAGPSGNPTVTAVFWLKTAQTSYGHLIGYGGNGETGNDFRVLIEQNCQNSMCFDTYGNLYAFNDQRNNSIWSQYIVIYDGSLGNNVTSSKIYKNGSLMTSICTQLNSSSTNIQGVFPITFGKYHGTVQDGYFSGILDDIAIYNRALTPQEISTLYQSQSTNSEDTGTTLPHDTLRVGINVSNPQRNLHVKDVMRLEPRNAPPTNPAKGDMYFDDRLNKLRVFDGTSWKNCW
jgi:hypothetical protein